MRRMRGGVAMTGREQRKRLKDRSPVRAGRQMVASVDRPSLDRECGRAGRRTGLDECHMRGIPPPADASIRDSRARMIPLIT